MNKLVNVTMQFFPVFKALLFVAILPNIALVLIAIGLDLNRPYINLDYLFVSLLILTRLRVLAIVFFIMLFAIDLLALAGQIFLFIRPDNLLYLLKFLPQTSGAYQFGIVSLLVLCVLLSWLQLSLPKFVTTLHALIVFNLSLIFYAVNVYGSGDPQERIWRVQSSPLVDSQLLFILDNRSDGFLQSFSSEGPALTSTKVIGASAAWFNAEMLNSKTELMLIASESWGVPLNPSIQQAILAPLTDLSLKVKEFESGQFSFSGPTLAAELRELCQLDTMHYNLKEVTVGFEGCLPNKLKQAGYKTHAIHGATGVMYDRAYWYPRAGFDNSTFFETQAWPRRCFSFPGACDIDMIETAAKFFSDSQPSFLYWLTLNSHSIYDPRDIHLDVFDCQRFQVDPSTQTCRNLKLQAQFFFGLAKAIEQGDFAGVDVIIVGDHTPIITNPEEKVTYFVDQQVPWVKFRVEGSITEMAESKTASSDTEATLTNEISL